MKHNIYAVVVFLTLAAAFAFNMPSNSGEWASWVQAVGSVAAIFGVIWLARADQRRIEDERLILAEVTAANIVYPLGALKGCMGALATAMSKDAIDQSEFATRRKDIENLYLPDIEQISKLIAIGGDVSIDISHVVMTARLAESLCERCSRTAMSVEQRKAQGKELAKLVSDVPTRIDNAREKLLKFLVERGHTVVKKDIGIEEPPAAPGS